MEEARLRQKIRDRTARVGVIGVGYVGLPLLVEFARAGYDSIGFDVEPGRVDALARGESYIPDVSTDDLSEAAARMTATSDFACLAEVDAICICVPTPLRKTKDPDISIVVEATERIRENVRRGQLVIQESTTYPGTTEEVILPRLSESGLRVGRDFFLAFSPERVDPGNTTFRLANTPKVVGGITPACAGLARLLYGAFIEQVIEVSSAATAEMVKLLENTFRSVNIAMVNEIAIMCDKLAIDVWEVIDAAASKPFGFMPFYPGPGLGGHCIPVDPHYLSWKLRTLDYRARFIELASDVNGEMPNHVASKVGQALNRDRKAVNGSKVLVLGVAYKANTSDYRESPALDVIGILRSRGADVCYHDPFVAEITLLGESMRSVELTAELLSDADCVVLVTDHTCFDMARVVEHCRVLVDTRNATRGIPRTDRVIRI